MRSIETMQTIKILILNVYAMDFCLWFHMSHEADDVPLYVVLVRQLCNTTKIFITDVSHEQSSKG